MFGERTVFDGMPRSGDAIAQEDTTCLLFYRDDIVPAMYSCPETMMYVIRILCNRAVRYLNTMELFAMQNVPTRLANFLLFLGDKYGREENGKIPLKINLSQTELSQQIATSRESINRQIKGFIEKGLITMENGEITLTDVPGLKKLCQVAVSD
jgi:CRP-like cAMP-binding protein